MQKKIYRVVISGAVVILLLSLSFSASLGMKKTPIASKIIEDTGTVKYIDIGRGFFEIIGDKGTYFAGRVWKEYYPVNLPDEFKKDGLRVKFIAALTWKGFFNIHMKGLPIKILKIEQIEEENLTLKLSVKKTYFFKEPITVELSLTNNGNRPIKVLDFGLDHFTVIDPSGKKLNYIGPIGKLRKPVILKPKEKISTGPLDITKLYGKDWFSDYEFKPGVYQIQGHYYSGPAPWPPDWNYTNIWVGSLKTPIYHFSIIYRNNLSFEIYMKERFKPEEPIGFQATITNNNDYPVNVTQMSIIAGSLTFKLITPDNQTLYPAPFPVPYMPPAVQIQPHSDYSVKIDDIRGLKFVHSKDESKAFIYNFTAGVYKIKAYYNSGVADKPVWAGTLNSSLHQFIIEEGSAIYGMVYEYCTPYPPIPYPPISKTRCTKPIPGAMVTASVLPTINTTTAEQKPQLVFTTYTDKNGRYELEVKPGLYQIKVYKEGYKTAYRTVGVLPGEKRREDFQLAPYLSVIYGVVIESTKHPESGQNTYLKPVPNATVIAYLRYIPIRTPIRPDSTDVSSYPVFRYKTVTDKKGRYEIKVELPGLYVIEVSKKGYQKEVKQIVIHQYEKKRVDFQLHRIYAISSII